MFPRFGFPSLLLLVSITTIVAAGVNITAPPAFQKEAPSYFEEELARARSQDLDHAIETLREITKKYPKIGDGWNALAEACMERNTLQDRLDAEKALKQALKRDHKNSRYNINLGKLLLLQGMPVSAKDQFDKTVKLNPQAVDAWLELGCYYRNEMVKYQNMIGLGDFNRYARNDFQNAMNAYGKVLTRQPDDPRAYVELGKLAYHMDQYDEMAKYMQRAVSLDSGSSMYHQYMGLALLRQKKYLIAMEAFEQAKQLMEQDERRIFESAEYFDADISLTDNSFSRKSASVTEISQRDKAYWTSQDPLFLTPFNERQLEHYARVSEANLHFTTIANKYSSGNKSIPGWKTEQGYMWIKYGRPLSWIREPDYIGEVSIGGPIDGPRNVQRWRYESFTVSFGENFDSGWGNAVIGGDIDPWDSELNEKHMARRNFERILRGTPAYFKPDYAPRQFDLPVAVAQFRGKNGKTDVLVSTGLPSRKLRFMLSKQGYAAITRRGVFLFNNKWKKLDETIEKLTVNSGPAFQVPPDKVFPTHATLQVPPGEYHLAVEVEEEFDKNTGVFRQPVTVRDFTTPGLQMSDILLADQIDPPMSGIAHSHSDFQFTPNIGAEFPVFLPVYIYYEVYHLAFDPLIQRTKYRVDCSMTLTELKPSGLWRSGAAGSGKISTSADYEGSSDAELQYLRINTGNAAPGVYTVQLRITDLTNNAVTQQETRLTLKPLEPREEGPAKLDPGSLKDGLQLLGIEAENPLTNYHLGVLYYNGGQLRESETAFRRALSFDSSQPASRYGLALALRDRGRIRHALDEALLALHADDSESRYRVLAGELAGALGQYETAMDLLNPADNVKDPARCQSYARLCDFPGGWKVATEYYDRASMAGMDRPEAQHDLGRSLLHMDRPDDAGVWFRLAGAIDPHYLADYVLRRTAAADPGWLRASSHQMPVYTEATVIGGDDSITMLHVPMKVRLTDGAADTAHRSVEARLWLFDGRWTGEHSWNWNSSVELPVAESRDGGLWCHGAFTVDCPPGRYYMVLLILDRTTQQYSHVVRPMIVPALGNGGLTMLPPVIAWNRGGDDPGWYSAGDTLHVSLMTPLQPLPENGSIRWTVKRFFKQSQQPKLAQWLGMEDHIVRLQETVPAAMENNGIYSRMTIPLNHYQPGAYLLQAELLDVNGAVLDQSARRFTVGKPGTDSGTAPPIVSLEYH